MVSDHKKAYLIYLQSKEWSKIRKYINSRFKCCQECGSKKRLQVHHLTYKNLFNEKIEDLQLLCELCHKKIHAKKTKKRNKKQTKQRVRKGKVAKITDYTDSLYKDMIQVFIDNKRSKQH